MSDDGSGRGGVGKILNSWEREVIRVARSKA